MAPKFLRPSPVAKISRSFAGHVKAGSVNPGVDYAAPTGSIVHSPEAGVVAALGKSSLVGWWVTIFHDNGYSSDLLHNTSISVKTGQRVARGQQIAVSGGTGSVATGPHIHWSLRPNHTNGLVNRGNVDGEALVGGDQGTSGSVVSAAFILAQLGVASLKSLQSQLGVKADGVWGPITAKALQVKVGAKADGLWGKASNTALQKRLKIKADGLWGALTTTALKGAISAKVFAPAAVPPVVTPPSVPVISTPTSPVVVIPIEPDLGTDPVHDWSADLEEIEGQTEAATADNPAPLSGLFAGNDRARKRVYLAYAGAALVLSFGPDIVVAGVLNDNIVPTFIAYVSLSASILLKIGTALGFVAAANTSK